MSEVGEFYQTEVKNNIKKKTELKKESNERSEAKNLQVVFFLTKQTKPKPPRQFT